MVKIKIMNKEIVWNKKMKNHQNQSFFKAKDYLKSIQWPQIK
jgi:hypothetical protein